MKDTTGWMRAVVIAALSAVSLASRADAATASPYVKVAADIPPVPLSSAHRMIAVSNDPVFTVDIALPARLPAAAALYARRVSTVGDPLAGHFLTAAQYADAFGPSVADYNAVVAWATSTGLGIHEQSAGRSVVSVTGHASTLSRAFHVGFKYFSNADGTVTHIATTQPSLPLAIAAKVAGVIGLSTSKQYAELAQPRPAGVPPKSRASGDGVGGGYSPADLRTAYSVPFPAVVGPKEVVAVYEQGGFYPSDIAAFTKANKLPSVPVTVRPVNGYGGGVSNPNVELETVLDIETLIGINPGLSNILVYEDGDAFNTSLLDSLTAMANDRAASVVSISYGIDEKLQGTTSMVAENAVLTQMAAEGQTVFVSSGDGGAYGDEAGSLNVEDPGSQPFVTCVGGTSLYTGPHGAYEGEETWNDLGLHSGATGGGVSSYWPLPSYQADPGSPPDSVFYFNGGSNTFRNVPDIAAVASPFTGESIYSSLYGGWLIVGGTSLATPIVAAEMSLYDQILQLSGIGHLGFFNPKVYPLASSSIGYGLFHDIRDGTNGSVNLDGIPGYSAGFNIDNVSGQGSIEDGANFFDYFISQAIAQTHPPAEVTNVTGTVSGTTATIKWTSAKPKPNGYIVDVLSPYNFLPLTEAPTTGNTVTISGLTTLPLYAFEVYSVTPTGRTAAPPIYLKVGGTLPASTGRSLPHAGQH